MIKRQLAVVILVLLVVSVFAVVDVAATKAIGPEPVNKPPKAIDKKPDKIKPIHKKHVKLSEPISLA